ncbi:MAG: ABC transporter permease [Acholeplasmataceae bacterium]|jgi:spermidine/putrescine transport system permease protein|nr:ABC transporter permease [Acholeplasmataceae bacterium]
MKKVRISKNGGNKTLNTILVFPYYMILFSLILVPIFIMVVSSFLRGDSNNLFQVSLTFENYLNFFGNEDYLYAMGRSIWLALLTTISTLLIGYPLAYFITKTKTRTQALLILLISAPMWINLVIRTIALKQIIELIIPSILKTNTAMVFGLTHVFLPFMVLPIYTILLKIDSNLIEAANDLGASKFVAFLKVILPLSLPGVMSGILMVFLPAATTLVIPKYLGNNVFLIGDIIERVSILSGNIGYGAAIAIILSIIMMAMMLVVKRVDKFKGEEYE